MLVVSLSNLPSRVASLVVVTKDCLSPRGLPMREVLSGLVRLSEPATTTVLLIELLPLDSLLPEDLPEDPLKPKPPSLKVGFEVLNIVLVLWIVRRLEPVLRLWAELGLKVLAKVLPARGLMDLEEAETLVRTLPTLEARPALDPAELLVTCRDFWLPRLEPALLLRAFFAKRGSPSSITAATTVIKAILTLFWYFGRSIIWLLFLQVVSVNSQKLTALLVGPFFACQMLV